MYNAEHLAAQESARLNAIATVAKLRKTAHAEIERLLTFLDETDGYTTNELEPSLGDTGPGPHLHSGEDDLEGDDSDLEPSLCGVAAMATNLMDGTDQEAEPEHDEDTHDREPEETDEDHDGCEPDVDNEPTLGWPEASVSFGSTSASCDDCEVQDHAPLPRLRRIAKGVLLQRNAIGRKLTGLTVPQEKAIRGNGPAWVRL